MADEVKDADREGAVERRDERGDAAEPDAPTTAEENEGMSTVLDVGPLDGVQQSSGEG
ncbi:MAG TPA: hypothetical protein VK422_21235 [Pyrinomonadaceae bacterium]|nr:hypothetical protein [Pyrinomonadaceae bacterium]